jgi:hypothetical protein
LKALVVDPKKLSVKGRISLEWQLHIKFSQIDHRMPIYFVCKTAKQRSSSSSLTAQTPSRDSSEHHMTSVSCATVQALDEGKHIPEHCCAATKRQDIRSLQL